MITNYGLELVIKLIRNIKIAIDSWEHIAEEEFFQALNKALKDFDFKATMRLIHEGSEVNI